MPLNAHHLVAETARELAAELWELYAANNGYYRQFKENGGNQHNARRIFINRVAPRMLEQARAALADILTGEYPESTKEKVFEALRLDNDMRANRTVRESMGRVPKHLN